MVYASYSKVSVSYSMVYASYSMVYASYSMISVSYSLIFWSRSLSNHFVSPPYLYLLHHSTATSKQFIALLFHCVAKLFSFSQVTSLAIHLSDM
jgi:hypothetical protein